MRRRTRREVPEPDRPGTSPSSPDDVGQRTLLAQHVLGQEPTALPDVLG